jgi:hypothetical protein
MSRKLNPLLRSKTPTSPFDTDRGARFAQGDPFAFPALGSPFGSRLTKRASLLPKSGKAKDSLYFDSDAVIQQRKHEDRPQVMDHTESVVSKVLAPVLLIVLATVVFSFNPFSCNLLYR